MSSRGSITLGELQGKLTMLEIACHRCDRRGRLSLERLIDVHGADTVLRATIATDGFPLSSRVRQLRAILEKLEPTPARPRPFPAPRMIGEPSYAPRTLSHFALLEMKR